MEIAPVVESRRFDRKARMCDVVGRHCDLNGKIRLFSGQTLDISLRGIGILIDSNDAPYEGDTVDVSLRVFDNEPPIKVVGYVSWSSSYEKRSGEPVRLGVELTGMAEPIRSYKRWLEVLTLN